MSAFVFRTFKGVAPKIHPRNLIDNAAQTATNCVMNRTTLDPLNGVSNTVATVPGGSVSIYKYEGAGSKANYWLGFSEPTYVVKGPVLGDTYKRIIHNDSAQGPVVRKLADTAATTYKLGVPAPTTKPTVAASGVATDTTISEERVYVYTYVNHLGEEGPPSPPSELVTVQYGQNVDLSAMGVGVGGYELSSKNIYRSVDGEYLYVGNVALATAATTDSVTAENLGEAIQSITWDEPVSSLTGFKYVGNGIIAGFTGKDIYMCEPFRPHAWPTDYNIVVDANVVAIAPLDSSFVVLTDKTPYYVSGSHPDSMGMAKIDSPQACVSARSVVTTSVGAVYASPDGLMAISGGSIRNLTENLFTRDQWQALDPSTILGTVYDNKYYGFYDDGVTPLCFVLDLTTGDLTHLSEHYTDAYYDAEFDSLFVLDGANVKELNAGSVKQFTWKSKKFYSPKAINLGAIKVEADSSGVVVKQYVDSVLKSTTTTTTASEVQRLPSGFIGQQFEFEIVSSTPVYSVVIGETMGDIANA